MGGGAMVPPFTNNSFATPPPPPPPARGTPSFQSPLSLSSICDGESWTKSRCIDYDQSNCKDLEIESFGGGYGKGTKEYPCYDFGSVPSTWEVEKAMSDLQSFMSGCYDPKEEMNMAKAMLNPHQSTLLQSPGYARLCDAFHMIQNEPATQKLVLSIACDKAVWEAMMSNKAVQNLQLSLICAAKEEESKNTSWESDAASLIVKLIMGITTSKLGELIQSFGSLLSEAFSEMFEPSKKEKPTSELSDLLEEKIRSSFLLSIVLLMIVVTTRSQGG